MSATDPTPATTPPTCDQDHNGFQTCRGPEDGCYALEGVYAEDARYIYPAREEWFATSLKNEHDRANAATAELETRTMALLEAAKDYRALEERANAYRDAVIVAHNRLAGEPFSQVLLAEVLDALAAALSPEASPSSDAPTEEDERDV
jgi:hypothetical protein